MPQERHRRDKGLRGWKGRRAPGQVEERRSQALCPRLQRPPVQVGHQWPQRANQRPQRDRRSREGRRGPLCQQWQ
jgi:hypothetical protein